MNDVVRVIAELEGWQERVGFRYRRLADALTAALDRGALDGTRLPAERRLAERLGVSRSTIVRAYSELRQRGLVTSRQRSATTVRATGRRVAASGPLVRALNHLPDGPAGPIDLCVGAPLLDAAVGGVVAGLADAAPLIGVHGYAPNGLPALRQAIADVCSRRGAPTSAEEILVTSGAQQAISLLAALLIGRHHSVVVECPTYSGALDTFQRAEGRVVPVPNDVAGMRCDALRVALERGPVALMYLLPNCHNPTGGRIAAGRRRQLLELAREYDVPVVEDQSLDELTYDGRVAPTLQAMAPDQVIAVGSLSKVTWGSLRVGWVRAPRSLILRLGTLKASWDLGASALDQVGRCGCSQTTASSPSAAAARPAIACESSSRPCARLYPSGRSRSRSAGGRSGYACRTAPGTSSPLRPGATVSWCGREAPVRPPGECVDCLRICFGASEAQLEEGVRRLALAWREITGSSAEDTSRPSRLISSFTRVDAAAVSDI